MVTGDAAPPKHRCSRTFIRPFLNQPRACLRACPPHNTRLAAVARNACRVILYLSPQFVPCHPDSILVALQISRILPVLRLLSLVILTAHYINAYVFCNKC
eukprot:COSAG06_NODE_19121_length_852_cov_1.872510_3_plen_100_part_01